jgi:hypothetical protein
MGTENALAEPSPTAANRTEPVAAAPGARPLKIHHFAFYGRASLDDLAPFAAAKVLVEDAGRGVQRKPDSRAARAALKVGPVRRHYVVQFMTGGSRIATRGVDIEMGSAASLLGSMSVREPHTGDQAKFPDIAAAETGFAVKVRPAGKRDGNMPAAADCVASPQRRTFELTVVNGSVIHCVWTWSGRLTMAA